MLRKLGIHVLRNAVAYLALFIALGGTSYAAAKFTGEDIVDESLTGVDVLNDSLTGDDILESSLGKVGDADMLDGLDSTSFLRNGSPAGGDLTGTYPNPSLADGVVTTAKFGAIPAAKVSRCCSISEVPGDGTATVLAFPFEEFDVGGIHNAANPSRLTAPVDGVYHVTANVNWPIGGGGGSRAVELIQNGFFFRGRAFEGNPSNSSPTTQLISVPIKLGAGDYLELEARQNSGDFLTVSTVYPANFSMTWVAPG